MTLQNSLKKGDNGFRPFINYTLAIINLYGAVLLCLASTVGSHGRTACRLFTFRENAGSNWRKNVGWVQAKPSCAEV
ncbi:MAG: hypothetical protein JST49_09065 [Bacteroidetes bacterium]|nr:hypothetical protein [Bacteroidota bacterium]